MSRNIRQNLNEQRNYNHVVELVKDKVGPKYRRMYEEGSWTYRGVRVTSHFSKWSRTWACFLGAGAIAGVYVSDWKVIATKIPFYRNQLKEESS